MWDDVVIGSGNMGCSALKVFKIPGEHSISENRTCYWCSGCILGLGITIFKDTDEGRYLRDMIEAEASLESIQAWLDTMILLNVDISVMRESIDQRLEKSFEAGMRAKAKEIRGVLGL